ncbi:MAG: type II toxin-antitoxin system PemK/MazF family toxin, partial [Bacilli bacterium]|nr:type II toxin-antitoxin system PemK/MazF family toxin [Bacilli bacterium]
NLHGTTKKIRNGMHCKSGDILLIRFPFTDLTQAKKRPVLVIKSDNELGDIVCFQITSQPHAANTCALENSSLKSGELKLQSFVKYDKCFTLNSAIVEKKLATATSDFMAKIKELFCNESF